MGNFIDAEISQPSTKDSTLVDRASPKEEKAFKATGSGPQEEQTIDILMRLAYDSPDDLGPDNMLVSFTNQNYELLKSQLGTILDELHAKACSFHQEAPGKKEAIRCLIVLGGAFPKKTLHFLARKMDELWKDTGFVFQTIKILKTIIHSNGLPEVRDTCPGLDSLHYRQGLLTKMLLIAALWSKLSIRIAAIELLGLVDSMIHEGILDLWLGRITQLLQYLKRGSDTFKQKDWEDMLLLFLEDTIFQISDELWVNYFVQSLILQLSNCSPCEKNFLYKCWGTAMKASRGSLIQPSLWKMIQEIRFYESEEREGLAYGLGICAMHYAEQVISVLDEYQSYIDQLQTEHYLKEGTEVPISKEQVTNLLLLGYYFVALLAPENSVLPVMCSLIFPRILQNYSNSLKDVSANSAFIGSVTLTCKAAKKTDETLSFQSKSNALNYLKDILRETPTCSREVENCQKAVKAITLLWKYDTMQKKQKLVIMDLCISSIMKFPPWDSLEHKAESADKFIGQSCYSITFDATYEIIKDLIEWQMDEGNLNRIITALENWLTSPKSLELERATRTLAQLLQIFKNQFTSEMKQSIAHKGYLTGLLVPCCVHKQAALRYWGKAATTCLLNIKVPSQIEISSTEFIKKCDEEKQCQHSTTVFKTAMLIIKYLPPEELIPFIKTTLVGMLQDESWSEGVVDVLKIVLLHKADELHNRVEILLYTMYYILYSSDNIDVKRAVRGSIGTLVHVEPEQTVNTLLTFAWPDNWIGVLSELEPDETSSSMEDCSGYSNTNEKVEKNGDQENMTNSHKNNGDLVNKEHQSSVHHPTHYFPYPSFHHQGQAYPNTQSDYWTPHHSSHLIVPAISLHRPSITEDEQLPEIQALWMSLAADYTVYPKVLTVLLNKFPTMDELRNETSFCLPGALSAVIWDFIAILEKEEVLAGKEDSLFYYCFLSIPGASTKLSNTSSNEWNRNCSPCSVTVQALQNIMKLAQCEFQIWDTIEEDHGWDMLMNVQEQHKGFASLGRAIRNCIPGFFPRTVIPDIFLHLFSPKEALRKDYAAFFAEFVGSPHVPKNETALMKKIYIAMKHLLNDRNNVIKMYGMRGLCNAVHSLPREVKKEKELILEVYLKALADPCYPNIRQEAMSGILKLLSYFSSIRTSTATVIAMQARSFFDDEDPLLRRSALEVFGHLSKFFYGMNALFCDQMEKSLADLLIHMQDDDSEVVETSKVTLQKCARFLRYKPVRDLIMTFLHNERAKATNSFLKDVSRLLVQHCPEKLNKKSAFRVAAALQLNNYLTQQEKKEENNT